MHNPMIGWEQESPMPQDYQFNSYLSVRSGDLYLGVLNLHKLFLSDGYPELGNKMLSPLELVYLPIIRDKIFRLQGSLDRAISELGYPGKFIYTYASKANAAEEVVRTILQTQANYELSSWVDVRIAHYLIDKGLLTADKWVVCNGFKQNDSTYMKEIIALQRRHGRVLPVIEDIGEIDALEASGLPFDVGLRLKTYGKFDSVEEMDRANSRFGMSKQEIEIACQRIAAAPNLNLRLLHAMTGSQLTDEKDFVNRLIPGLEVFMQLKQVYPGLDIFDFGGGVPVAMTLDFDFDYDLFARKLMETIKQMASAAGVTPPDVMGEMGRYTVAEHGAHLFKIQAVKNNASEYPWYIIDGSIMSSFPDSWALGEHFIVLPLTHLDKPFQRVQLGGITCDSDDIYPPEKSQSPLYLPVETEDLYIGFFSIGAYQEMLGGVGGSKHCVIPEASELIVDLDEKNELVFKLLQGQNAARVLLNLGYK